VTEIDLRRANKGDIEQLIQRRWEVCAEEGVTDTSDENLRARYEEALQAFLEQYIEEEQCQIIVAVAGTEIVATSTLWLFPILPWPGDVNQWLGFVTNVYTVPAYRRQRLALRLMDRIKEVARQHAVTELLLETSEMAAPMYDQLGFRPSKVFQLGLERRP
jgi:GNAT superfamily N-acetyltransferase